MPKLLFITTTNLTTNPRLLKELKLASENGHECTFIGFKLGNWSDGTEQEHLKLLAPVKPIYLSATKDSFNNWLLSTIVWKFSIFFNKLFIKSLCAYAHNKRTWQLVLKLKRIKSDYDLIIGHNLGALYPAIRFAKKHNIPFAFDIEDYHPGEKCSPAEKHRREFLMQKLLPKATYISYASPLIGEHSLALISKAGIDTSKLDSFKYMATSTKCISRTVCDTGFPDEIETPIGVKLPDNFLVNNSFSQNEFQLIENSSEKIRFVWFSQNITWGRGLEQMIPALSKFREKIDLYLIGNKRLDFHEKFLKNYDDFINYIEPLPQKELNLKLSQFDIGLAIEISNVDLNKEIALSNKIFAYTQAGLFVLATDTSAQKRFIEEHNPCILNSDYDQTITGRSSRVEISGIGLLTPQSSEEMEKAIEIIINGIGDIRASKKMRFEYAKQLAWEIEGLKLSSTWNKLFW